MKVSRYILVLALVAAFATMAAINAEARCPGMKACHGMGPMWFNLNDDQKDKAKDLMTEFMKKKEALRAEVGKRKVELMELTSKDELDEAAVEKKMEELWAAKDKMRAAKREMAKKFLSILTPEQKKDLGPLWMGFGGRGFGKGWGCGFRRGFGHGKGHGMGRGKGYGPHGSGPKCPYMKEKGDKTKDDSDA